jgi:hypothetical protein
VVLDDLMFVKRPVVVFADSPNDPNFIRQMELIGRDPASLLARDVVVITDTDPAARSELRKKLRPRGFSLVLLDKDLKPPHPQTPAVGRARDHPRHRQIPAASAGNPARRNPPGG